MRTTIDINDALYREARRKAADEGVSLKEIVERALKSQLGGKGARGARYRLAWRTEKGRLRPGVRLDDRDALIDIMEGRS
ncbi:MAG: DUF2191 domain-containing protein [Deltaproteobacteria bacterium]|nr:DUF2191 domain-containing protein [Deltaproteobacteria bacterium]